MKLRHNISLDRSGGIDHQGMALVNFCTDWSPPCNAQASVIHVMADRFAGNLVVADIDIDEHHRLGQFLQITSIPTVILFRNGDEIARFVGVQDVETLSQAIAKALHFHQQGQ